MRKHTKFLITGLAAALAFMTLTGCASKEEKAEALAFQTEADNFAAGNNYEAAQASMKKALEKTPKDKELQEASDSLDKKAKENAGYSKTLQAAITAIEADDAQALMDLQNSEEGQALVELIGEAGTYFYMPEGGTTGKGIGYYGFEGCACNQWYYGDITDGKREGNGIWYYVSTDTVDGSLYKEVYNGQWSGDKPNGTGHQSEPKGIVYTEQDFQVADGLFSGTYPITDTLEDGTAINGTYTLLNGKYAAISDEELTANSFAIPDKPHLAISFLYDGAGKIQKCTMLYAEDVSTITAGVTHFR